MKKLVIGGVSHRDPDEGHGNQLLTIDQQARVLRRLRHDLAGELASHTTGNAEVEKAIHLLLANCSTTTLINVLDLLEE